MGLAPPAGGGLRSADMRAFGALGERGRSPQPPQPKERAGAVSRTSSIRSRGTAESHAGGSEVSREHVLETNA
jgi:hypothetical protein